MKYLAKKTLIFLIGLFLIASCRPSAQKTSDQESKSDLLGKAEIEKSIKEAAYPLPEPFEVYVMLEDIGTKYLGNVLNPVDNVKNYYSQKDKALNVGVYAADLGYAVTYKKQQDIKIYSKALKSLVDDLGISVDYTQLQSEESRQELVDKDSLVAYISTIFYDSYTFLYRESTPSLAGLMAAGAWTEGLYIATHISDDSFNNTDIVRIIHEQGKSLEELIQLLSKFEEDDMVVNLLGAFKKLDALYKEAGDSLTKEQLKSIISVIETIRESIIS